MNKPAVQDAAAWRLDKLAAMINPLDANLSIGADGTRCSPSADGRTGGTCGVHLHAVDSGAFYSGSEGKLGLSSLDTMLVSVGDPLPSPGPYITPNPLGGVHFSLVDNTWNTNCKDLDTCPGRSNPPSLSHHLGRIPEAHSFARLRRTLSRTDPEWYPFIEANTATPYPGGEGDEDSRFRFVISIT